MKEFEALIKERNVCFMYDHEDGYFIMVSDKGCPPQVRDWCTIAEVIQTHNHDLNKAIEKAAEWYKLNKTN